MEQRSGGRVRGLGLHGRRQIFRVMRYGLVPSLIEELWVVQGLRVVPVFLYLDSMKISLKSSRRPGITEGGRSDQVLGVREEGEDVVGDKVMNWDQGRRV